MHVVGGLIKIVRMWMYPFSFHLAYGKRLLHAYDIGIEYGSPKTVIIFGSACELALVVARARHYVSRRRQTEWLCMAG